MNQSLIANEPQKIIYGLGDTGLSTARYLYAKGDAFCVYDAFKNPPSLKKI